MRIITADWSGFANHIINLALKSEGEVRLEIDDVKIGARSNSVNIYQQWWWSPDNNRAHPQFGSFFHRLIETLTHPAVGRVEAVTFAPKRGNLLDRLFILYWRARGLFVNRRRQEEIGWDEFEEYMLRDLKENPKHEREITVKGVATATHTLSDKLYFDDWWRGESPDARKHLSDIAQKGITVAPITATGADGRVTRAIFRLTDNAGADAPTAEGA